MSYWVTLCPPDDAEGSLDAPEVFEDGGTYAIGGESECTLNITYNYSRVYGALVRDLEGRTAAETTPALRAFVEQHAGEPTHPDYWEPTPGNAAVAIGRLLSFAERHPTGVWRVN